MDRRTLLRTGVIAALGSLAGCKSLLIGPDYVHFVSLFNYTAESHTMTVRARDPDDEIIFDREFSLEAEDVIEDVPLNSRPETVALRLDNGEFQKQDWPGEEYCAERGKGGKSGLSAVISHPRGESDGEKIYTRWNCYTITA